MKTEEIVFPEQRCAACRASKSIHLFSPAERGKKTGRCMKCIAAHNEKRRAAHNAPGIPRGRFAQ